MSPEEGASLIIHHNGDDAKIRPEETIEETGETSIEEISEKLDEIRPSMPFLIFRLHSLICIFSLALMAVSQALPKTHDVPYLILRLEQMYILFACCIGIITELEVSQWLNEKTALSGMMARGAFYLFFAIIAAEESTETTGTEGHLTSLLLSIAGIGFVISGGVYILIGLFCLKGLRDKSEKENNERIRKMIAMQEIV